MIIVLRVFLLLISLISSSEISIDEYCFDSISNSSSAITALILARGGSKGIKLKNIQRIDGVSLLGISLTALQQSNKFESIWVSTDHKEIADEAERYEVQVHWRDPKTALDSSTSIESVQEFLKNHPKVSNLVLVQCTSPFVSPKYLKKAVRKFKRSHCVFSAFRSYKLRWKRDKNRTKVLPINFDYRKRPRRQDWNGELVEAGMFYFSSRTLLDGNLFQDESCGVVEINPEDSLEIDTHFDLDVARALFKLRMSKRGNEQTSKKIV